MRGHGHGRRPAQKMRARNARDGRSSAAQSRSARTERHLLQLELDRLALSCGQTADCGTQRWHVNLATVNRDPGKSALMKRSSGVMASITSSVGKGARVHQGSRLTCKFAQIRSAQSSVTRCTTVKTPEPPGRHRTSALLTLAQALRGVRRGRARQTCRPGSRHKSDVRPNCPSRPCASAASSVARTGTFQAEPASE